MMDEFPKDMDPEEKRLMSVSLKAYSLVGFTYNNQLTSKQKEKLLWAFQTECQAVLWIVSNYIKLFKFNSPQDRTNYYNDYNSFCKKLVDWTKQSVHKGFADKPKLLDLMSEQLSLYTRAGVMYNIAKDEFIKITMILKREEETGKPAGRQQITGLGATPGGKEITKNDALERAVNALRDFRSFFLRCAAVEGEIRLWRACEWGPPEAVWDTFGTLTIMRIGPEYQCSFKPAEGEATSWTERSIRSQRAYERILFQTWSYNDGYSPDRMGKPAEWHIISANAAALESKASEIEDTLLAVRLFDDCKVLAERALQVLRNNNPRWSEGQVQWSYLKELDAVIKKLEFARKQAAMGRKPEQQNPPYMSITDLIKHFQIADSQKGAFRKKIERCRDKQVYGEGFFREIANPRVNEPKYEYKTKKVALIVAEMQEE
jgi:hypothetical protein